VKHNSIGKKRKTKYLKFKKSKKKKWIIKNNVRDKWSVRRIVHTQYDYYTTNFFPFSRPLVF
jgi:predicted metalloprotease with PDZ domain